MNETKLQAATKTIPDASTIALTSHRKAMENQAADIVTFVTAALAKHLESDSLATSLQVDIRECTFCHRSVDMALDAFRSKGYDATVLTGAAINIQLVWKSL